MLPQKSIKPKREKTPEQALAALMRLCARAEKSSGDALRLMRTWGVEERARQGVLQQLITQRFIDDERYAHAFVREKEQLNGWGAYKIRASLRNKGISEEIAAAALAQSAPEAVADRLLMRLQRKARTTRHNTPYELRTKLIRYGLSLGYEYETVLDTVSQLITEESCNENSDF